MQANIEPPLPGLCSQPGADLDAYQAVKRELQLLGNAVSAVESACSIGSLRELLAGVGGTEEHTARFGAVMAGAMGLATAACGRGAEALVHMPLGGPCSGGWAGSGGDGGVSHNADLRQCVPWVVFWPVVELPC